MAIGDLSSIWPRRRLIGPYTVINTSDTWCDHDIQDDKGNVFKVNGQCLKTFLEPSYNFENEVDVIDLVDFNKYA